MELVGFLGDWGAGGEVTQILTSRGRRSRNKVFVGEPADGSLQASAAREARRASVRRERTARVAREARRASVWPEPECAASATRDARRASVWRERVWLVW